MKLTVGSLPSAVYWRRRAVVFGGILIVVLLLYAACSGSEDSGKKQKTAATSRSGSPESSASLQTPAPESAAPTEAAKSETPSSPPQSPSAASASCTDDEIQLTPAAASVTVARGQGTLMLLKVKNISARSCSRDLGADAQELYLLEGSTKVWSSDACDAPRGTLVRTLAPGSEQVFQRQWDGKATSGGCDARALPPAGQYQLVARLGDKTSAPVTFTIS